ncbi:MAG: single-stranded DNA-binding protein [Microcella sp.]
MTDTITVTGLVATEPRHITTANGLTITSFRLASNQRRFGRGQNAWIDGDTNWYTVTAFRQLGMHVASSVRKGERVVVAGRVRQRDWQSDTNKGTTIEIDADTVGHDLTFGRSTFTRTVKAASAPSDSHSAPAEAQQSSTEDGPTPEAAEPSDAEAVAPF